MVGQHLDLDEKMFGHIMARKVFVWVDGGPSQPIKRVQTGGEDPHQHEQKYMVILYLSVSDNNGITEHKILKPKLSIHKEIFLMT